MKIILDTNFLIYCAKNKLDYVEAIRDLLNEDYELVVPMQVVEELKNLKEKTRKIKDKEAAGLALQLLKKNKIKIIKIRAQDADDAIMKVANKKTAVATMDRILKKQLKGKARILNIRQKKKLEIA